MEGKEWQLPAGKGSVQEQPRVPDPQRSRLQVVGPVKAVPHLGLLFPRG